jgi:hypothetical protein
MHGSYNWTVESLLVKHPSRPFNPNIANVFYLAGFIESWGRGIEKICEACKADDLPIQEFTVNPSDIMVKFTAPEDRIVHGIERVTEKVTDGERAILQLLEIDLGYTYTAMSVILKLSRKTVSERIKKLKEKEMIERVGTDAKGYWRIIK